MTLNELSKLYDVSHFVEIDLSDMIQEIGEEKTKEVLSYFSCPQNQDVDCFLKEKAIAFSKRDFAKTTLVYWESADGREKALVGYYTVAEKVISLDPLCLSSKDRRKLYGHMTVDETTKKYVVPAPLIAQLGKNFADGNDVLISGSDLLQLAMNKIKLVQNIIGGRIAYLECEDKPKLVDFYSKNNFKYFGRRELDRDETNLQGTYLLQFLTIL